MDGKSVISVSHLTKTYKILQRKPGFIGGIRTLFSTKYDTVRAVDDISFDVASGELLGYIGPNGAGKSTTIKMLTGVLMPSSGDIDVDGLRPFKNRVRNAMKIGVLFGQRSQLVWSLPPSDTFELMKRLYAVPANRFRANLEQFIELLGLDEFLNTPVRQLSLGQRMRCELVASMLHDPSIVYLDEPTIGLDVVAKERIREFIAAVNRERKVTFLLTTHDLTDIERLCKRVIILDKGVVVYDGDLGNKEESRAVAEACLLTRNQSRFGRYITSDAEFRPECHHRKYRRRIDLDRLRSAGCAGFGSDEIRC